MKLNLLLLVFLSSTLSLFAQKSSISGKVIDKETKETIPYASISIKENDAIINGGISDENGLFSIKGLEQKEYNVEIQFIGYKTQTLKVNLSSNREVNLGTISLSEDIQMLDEIEIVKELSTVEQKIDRKVINVGRDLTTAGGTASEIMNNIPSVNVDQDGKISLRGNQNVRILIDGRPTNIDPAQLLKQIPSTSIKRIELITNPSAKYNPEGMSGIINIVLHKNMNDGFNGSFNAGINFGETPKFNNSLDMNYRTGKVNFFANGGSNFGEYFNGGYNVRDNIGMIQALDIINDNESYIGKFGMDYYINDKNTLSGYMNINTHNGIGTVNTDISYPEDSAFTNIFQSATYKGNNKNNTYNLAYKHLFDKEGHTLDFETNVTETKSNQNAFFDTTTGGTENFYQDNIKDERLNTNINLDYVNPITENSNLELGAEARIIRSDNTYGTTNPLVTNPSLQNSVYSYDIDIYSAYATFGQKFSKFSYQLGARFESYKAKANFNKGETTFNDDYITIYPSAYLTYNLNEKNMLQLSYSRRVDRPSLEQTKPIREFSTPLVTSLGNQYLQPQFTNSVELNYTKMFSKGSFSAGVFYRLINDEISRVIYPDETSDNDQALIMSYANFDNNSSFGFEVSANYKITKWWDMQPSIDFSSISQKGVISVLVPGTTDEYEPTIREIEISAFNARLNNNFRVNRRLSFLLFGFYRGPVDGIQNNSKEMYKIDTGARYTLLDNKMTLSLRFNDVFETMRYAFDAQNPYPMRGEFTWESRTVYFGLNYMFGGGKNRALQRKQRDNNTIQGSSGGMF